MNGGGAEHDADDVPEAPDRWERRSRAYRALVQLERWAGCVLLVGVLTAVLVQVVTRYVLTAPLTWTEELARFLLVWLTFVAAGYVMSRRLHIAVDLLAARLPARWSTVLDVLAGLIVVACSATVAGAGTTFAAGSAMLLAPATSLPLSVVYSAAVVGFALIAAHGALNVYVTLRHPEDVPGTVEALAAVHRGGAP